MNENSILLPSKLKIVEENEINGVYQIEGLYPGYGHTLGNSIRRILLSSLPGAAITSVRVDGADHEFTTLEGVREDVLNILLNLKKIRFRMDGDEAQEATISIKGVTKVTAKDVTLPGGLEIMNPDAYIAEVTKKDAVLSITMKIEHGVGYVPREILHTEKVAIGAVALDAMFSPIRKVSYEVEDMRVGDRTDHNRLQIKIETDGSLSPKEALENSIVTMMTQLRAILDLKEIEESIPRIQNHHAELMAKGVGNEDTQQEEPDYTDTLKTRVDTLTLSSRTMNALASANIRTIGGLVQKTKDEILEFEGIGQKGLEEIEEILSAFSLSLKA